MIAEILSIGTELLMGQIANTDAQFISRRLGELGITIYRHSTVGDNPARVKEAIEQALSRSDIVITTGGLGPTEDDLTKEMVAEYFGLEMVLDEKSLETIKTYMNRIDRPMTPNNTKQALFPKGSIIMPNFCGTAPGCIVEQNGKAVAVLPGPPRELKDMFDRQLAPYLEKRGGKHIESRFLRIFGIGESSLETMLIDLFHSDNPTLALYCGAGECTARISASAYNKEEALERIAPIEAEIRRRCGNAVYGLGNDNTLGNVVRELLQEKGVTVAFAESMTQGMLTLMLTEKGDCDNLKGTIISAAGDMTAEHVRELTGADIGVSAARVEGGAKVRVATEQGAVEKDFHFRGDGSWAKTLAAQNALNMLRLSLI